MDEINQVEYFDILGTKVRQISCITDEGVPSSTRKALVGTLYMDTDSGEIYKCTSSNDNGTTWVVVGSGGSSAGSNVKLTTTMLSRVFTILDTDKECVLPYNWSSTDSGDGSATGNGTAEWSVNGSRVSVKSVSQGDNEFDIRQYLSTGIDNNVILKITDAYGTSRNLAFTISVNSYSLKWNLKEVDIYDATSLLVKLEPIGTGDKLVKVSVDGTVVSEQIVSTYGRNVNVTVPVQSHGAHVVEAWFEVIINGESISTEHLVHTGIWMVAGITTKIVAILTPEVSVGQYGTATIRYAVIDPTSETSTVILYDAYGTVGSLENVDRTVQTWSYKTKDVGNFTLSVSCGAVVGRVELKVRSLGYNIAPVTAGLVVDLDPSGHNNLEVDKDQFGYIDKEGVNHPLIFSENFDWTHGGFQTDADGVTAFVIKRGCYVSLDTSLFNRNPKTTGMAIKFVFKSENVRNYDAQLMSCKSGNVGVVVKAQDTVFSSELETLSVRYFENRKIEMDFVVNPSTTDSFAYICLKGIPSCPPIRYGNTDSWVQSVSAPLTIGSEDADVWIYRIKEYEASLNRYEILDNFIADCADPAEMVARYERNDVYDDAGNLNIVKLYKANPNLRVFHFKADRMTTGKNDEVPADVEMFYGNGGEDHHLIAKNAIFKAQGTSSLEYILAALNVDVDFGKATSWVTGNGRNITSYAMRSNSIPVNYFNLKANVASSESANNVVLADDYYQQNPYICDPRIRDPRVRDTVEGNPCCMFFTNTSDETIEVACRTVQPGETILYFAGDMNNSKKNFDVFGQDNTVYPKQCCVEIMNNTELPCRFRENIVDEPYDGDHNFEFRYPKSPTTEMIRNFEEMHAWVVSTTVDLATGKALANPIIYGETTYTKDDAAYRKAKFVNEFENYFVKDAMLFHYLFTERHCMTDNRAKNVFMCYEYVRDIDDYRWSVRCDYDNDTSEGCDNSGGATFSYGIEDTDIVGSSYAFNANDSTLWCNIRDLMFNDLKNLYIGLKGGGTWSADRVVKKFNNYQDATPEALRIEDMWNKYFYPWTNKDASAYALKCHGNKEYWREQFEQYQQVYMDSKYCDVTDRSNAISMRATINNAAAGNLTMTAYCDMYMVVMYGNGGTARVRTKRNTPTLIECPTDSLGDTETYIFSASHLVAISSLAELKPKFVIATTASRLQQLIIGSDDVGYQNLNLNQIGIANNEMLEILNLQSTPNLKTALDLSKLISLEEFLANGSGITGVTFASGCPLKTIRLPDISSLVLLNLTELETFVIGSKNLLTIRVENCPTIDTYDICSKATNLTRGRLTNVIWNCENPDVILRLSKLQSDGGINASGEIINGFVLTGVANIESATQAEVNDIKAAFPELTVNVTRIVPSYTVLFINHDDTILNTQIVREGGFAKNPINVGLINTPVKESDVEYHYTFNGWDSYLGPITANTSIRAMYTRSDRYYSVRYWNNESESKMLQEDIVIAHGNSIYMSAEPREEGKLWAGWDADGTNVVSDMDIHSIMISPVLPSKVSTQYDYIYSNDPNDINAYSIEEFFGILYYGKVEEYLSLGDRIKVLVDKNDVFTDTEFVLELRSYKHFESAEKEGEFAGPYFGMVGLANLVPCINLGGATKNYFETDIAKELDSMYPEFPLIYKSMIECMKVRTGVDANIVMQNVYLTLESRAELGASVDETPYKEEIAEGANEITFACYTDNASRIKRLYNGSGAVKDYWLRSCNNVSCINTDGSVKTDQMNNRYKGFSFGFCLRRYSNT